LPDLNIIAGPNGTGKTTFAREYLASGNRRFEFVNADEIARGLRTPSDFSAARIMITRIDELVDANVDFVIDNDAREPHLRPENSAVAETRLSRFADLHSPEFGGRFSCARPQARGNRRPTIFRHPHLEGASLGARNILRPFTNRSSTRGTNGTVMRAHSRCEIQEDGTNRKVEIERMQAAFKRAAEKATRGTREERSGRFEARNDSRLTRGDTQPAKPGRGGRLKK
jgi:hypothetical protein